MLRGPSSLLIAAFALSIPTASAAQEAAPKYAFVAVYGEDYCPNSTADKLAICLRFAENQRPGGGSDRPATFSNTRNAQFIQMSSPVGLLSCPPGTQEVALACIRQLLLQTLVDVDEDARERSWAGRSDDANETRWQEGLTKVDEYLADYRARLAKRDMADPKLFEFYRQRILELTAERQRLEGLALDRDRERGESELKRDERINAKVDAILASGDFGPF